MLWSPADRRIRYCTEPAPFLLRNAASLDARGATVNGESSPEPFVPTHRGDAQLTRGPARPTSHAGRGGRPAALTNTETRCSTR
jgi:hypothetical protein